MQEMTKVSVRDSAGVLSLFFFVQCRTQNANPFYSLPILSCMSSGSLSLSPSLIFFLLDIDETNHLSINGVSTSFSRCGIFFIFQVIFHIYLLNLNRISLE